ncbi:MAG TPA: hypothetical protein VJ441_00940 [Dehalococcoidia bacterium]|nr:hypothetical protein [Dehalococcoidia bacterium]
MRLTQLFTKTLREAPAEAETVSHRRFHDGTISGNLDPKDGLITEEDFSRVVLW